MTLDSLIPQPDPDDELLRRTATGDAEAFGMLFERRQGDVYRFALHMTGSAAVADDVTQDVFLLVMRDAHRYEPGRSTVPAWLCGIARNVARQRLERDRTIQPLGVGDAEDAPGPSVHPDPLADMAHAERIETLREAVLTLPLRYREALVLCDLQELTYAEAADALGCAIGTVRSRLHRARALLAAKMMARHASPHDVGEDRNRRLPRTRCWA